MRSDICEGGTFPDYELADQAGQRRSLSELQGGNAMVLPVAWRVRPQRAPISWPTRRCLSPVSKRLHAVGCHLDRQPAEHQ